MNVTASHSERYQTYITITIVFTDDNYLGAHRICVNVQSNRYHGPVRCAFIEIFRQEHISILHFSYGTNNTFKTRTKNCQKLTDSDGESEDDVL